MTNRSPLACLAIALATATTLAACGGGRIGKPVVWPEPPATGRVRFVTAFSTTAHLDRSGWGNFKRSVLGGGDVVLKQPMGAALSPNGRRLYISDMGLGTVLVADFDKQRLTRLTKTEMKTPLDVAVDADENVYVTDALKRSVHVFDKRGKLVRMFGAKDLESPKGIAVDRERGLVYVSDAPKKTSPNHRIRVFDLTGKLLRDIEPPGGGATKGGGDGQVYFPMYLQVDDDGNLLVSDMMNFRIQKFSPKGAWLTAYGHNGDQPGDFRRIKDLDVDGFGNIYVVDREPGVIQMFNRTFELLMWVGPQRAFLEFPDMPTCMAIDRTKNLIYLCNTGTGRINVYELINTNKGDAFLERRPNKAPAPSPAAPSD